MTEADDMIDKFHRCLLQLDWNQAKEFPLTVPNKAEFIVNPDPRNLIDAERTKRPWMKHSVALLIVSRKVDQIGLVLPASAASREVNNVRVPPQQYLRRDEGVDQSALRIAGGLVAHNVKSEDLTFLGSARGNLYREGQRMSYGKWVHWVGLHLKRRNGVFNENPTEFAQAHWYHTNQLLAMNEYVMTERKFVMMLQALAVFNALGADGRLTRRAKAELAA